MAWGRETWLDLEFCTEFPKLGIIELLVVVRNDGLGDFKSAHDRLPDEPGGVSIRDCSEGFCFHPFGEVVNDNHDEFGLASTSGQGTDQVDVPLGEGVGTAERNQFCW